MLSIIGFITILVVVGLLLSGRLTPMIPLVLIPIVGALAAGFGFEQIGDFFNEGVGNVISVVVMFIFAILYFGLMQDAGLFDPLINKMVVWSKGNVITVSVASVLIAAVAHLDGSGASTFLITIPPLLPLYQRLRMNPYLLLLLVGGSASVMNMLPWAGPLGRTASVLKTDVTQLWHPLIPIQIIGLVLMLILAIFLGFREKKRIEQKYGVIDAQAVVAEVLEKTKDETSEKNQLARPKMLWFNVILTIAVIGVLVWGIIPAGFAFMIGFCIALPLNYPQIKDQTARIRAHAPNALTMASIILAAGSFLGILSGSGMLNAIAESTVQIMPGFVGPYLHLVLGVLGLPFDLLLSTDAYYFALLPVADQIGSGFGIDSLSMAYSMIVGNIVGTFISPFSPALWMALGLANLEMGKHIRYNIFWLWGISLILIVISVLIGVIHI
ncbi:CitMHS family transporter [Kroppenstedtia eburnea]|uniref:Citrate-Mg2+:H+ or citrate-Ca2+:H+ symporter, CitMHS family n=1 Tax=Kroppenstedtia eburnea TaxID=714067 RepID=A0A1N7KPF2_9BACL|nr:CitMHS family transporter [Kroppenstedtia eburnea]EGK12491.1 CitMHS family citrate-divalent cation:proton (H+) symporter [Desmospora sp. 8437]QKI82875.1 CitMHS family transporter [Kroppenstedtia eburnea]SIS63489.1 citrate-Mg2+:H+ or citrate-Ca2+:H+ symporter, CitMHS family [Kroppenstedtia eburnea]